MNIAPYAKALTGAVVTGLTGLSQALDDGSVTAQEWIGVAVAVLIGSYAVWQIPNRDPAATHQEESVQPPEAGTAPLVTIVIVVVAVLLLAWLLQAVL